MIEKSGYAARPVATKPVTESEKTTIEICEDINEYNFKLLGKRK